jgi:hypothetical protein
MSSGPSGWKDSGGSSIFSEGLWVNGDFIEGGKRTPPIRLNAPSPGVTLDMLGNINIEQMLWIEGDAPVNLGAKFNMQLNMVLAQEDDYWKFRELQETGIPAEFWFDYPVADRWYIPGMESGQTEWKTSRKSPWTAVTGITQTSHPPDAYIDGVQQTIITSGTPAAGEVKVPNTSGYLTIETPVLTPGTDTWLVLRYHPVMYMKLQELRVDWATHNRLLVSMELLETFWGSYPSP